VDILKQDFLFKPRLDNWKKISWQRRNI